MNRALGMMKKAWRKGGASCNGLLATPLRHSMHYKKECDLFVPFTIAQATSEQFSPTHSGKQVGDSRWPPRQIYSRVQNQTECDFSSMHYLSGRIANSQLRRHMRCARPMHLRPSPHWTFSGSGWGTDALLRSLQLLVVVDLPVLLDGGASVCLYITCKQNHFRRMYLGFNPFNNMLCLYSAAGLEVQLKT